MRQVLAIVCAISVSFTSFVASAQEVLDKVAVVVNDGVVLDSEIEQMIRQVKLNAQTQGLRLPDDEVLREQAIDRLVLRELQLQMAQRMGIEVSDAQLQMTIESIAAEEGMGLEAFRQTILNSGMDWETYLESVRREMVTGEVQRNAVRRRVYISPQEISNLTEMMAEMTQNEVEYRLSQILIGITDSNNPEQVQRSRRLAEEVLARLRDGADFAETALTSSSGSRALEGGDLGWMNINAMPTLFAEAVRDKRKGELIGPIKSGIGFHILKVSDVRGIETVEIEEVKVRHILITPSIILSDNRAKEMLTEIRTQILNGEISFKEAALEYSADPGSAGQGGELGWSEPNVYAEAFQQAIARSDIGEISMPFRSEFGWHILEVQERRTQDATERSNQNRAYQLIYSRKYQEELENWQQEIRDQAYIERVD